MTFEPGSHLVSSGALATLSGAKTGRSPRDKRVVREPDSEGNIWWNKDQNGSPNFEMDERQVHSWECRTDSERGIRVFHQ